MTEASNQGSPNSASGLGRSRRAAAAVAVSVGVTSLVYGTSLVLPADAMADTTALSCASTTTGTATTPADTATATDSATDPATDSAQPSDAASATATDSAADSTTGSAADGSSDPTATASASASASATATDSASASASPSSSPCSVPSSNTLSPTKRASATRSTVPVRTASATTTATASATGGKGAAPTTAPASQPSIPVYTVSPTGSSYYYTAVPPGNAGYQLPTGTITRAQIIARAELWVAQQVPYSQTAWWTNTNGTYRQDCSGYVSMAWDLDQYTDFWTGNLNLVSRTIPAATLLPGDILLSSKHTILFAGWADTAHTEFDYFEEAHQGTNARYVVDAPLSAFLDNGFAPFRYDGIVGSSALSGLPASGQQYAALAAQGSEVDPPGVSGLQPAGLASSAAASATSASASAAASSARAALQVEAAADVSDAVSRRDEGLALGVGGVFLLVAGLMMRRPIRSLPARRGRH